MPYTENTQRRRHTFCLFASKLDWLDSDGASGGHDIPYGLGLPLERAGFPSLYSGTRNWTEAYSWAAAAAGISSVVVSTEWGDEFGVNATTFGYTRSTTFTLYRRGHAIPIQVTYDLVERDIFSPILIISTTPQTLDFEAGVDEVGPIVITPPGTADAVYRLENWKAIMPNW